MTQAHRFVFASALIASLSTASALADEVRMRNGDRLTGTVLRKDDGHLVLKTVYAGEVKLAWGEVAGVVTERDVSVMLGDGTLIKGRLLASDSGKVRIKAGEILETAPIAIAQVAHINPPPEVSGRGVRVKGRVNVGAAMNRGNTDADTLHADAEVVARTRSNRYTLGGTVDRAEDRGVETRNSSSGHMKYDHFLNDKWYAYANGTFLKDRFKDLNLRTTLGGGVGYQFIESDATNLQAEAGLDYVNNDFVGAADESYPALHWALKFDHYLIPERLQVFHQHDLNLSVEDTGDYFVRTQTGLRMPVSGGITATLQLNADYDSAPAPGRDRTDTAYLFNLGYAW